MDFTFVEEEERREAPHIHEQTNRVDGFGWHYAFSYMELEEKTSMDEERDYDYHEHVYTKITFFQSLFLRNVFLWPLALSSCRGVSMFMRVLSCCIALDE